MIMWSSAVGCIVILILGLLVAPLTAHAQQPSKVPRVGVLWERTPPDPFVAVFRQGLRELGYIEGQSIVIEDRWAYGVVDRFPALIAELIDLNVDVLVVAGTFAAQAAKAHTSTVPIVFTIPGNPVEDGLVASLAHPGGNATGLSTRTPGLTGKQLEILKAAVPQVSRVTVLYNLLVVPVHRLALQEAHEAARALAMELQALEVRQRHELASAFAVLTAWRAGAVLALSGPPIGNELAQLAQLAAEHRLPAIFIRKEFVEVGALLAYGPSFADNFRRAATYVDKILKGAKPADLPVEQPTKYELVINLKTARELGLTIPPTLLFQVDEVIL
jgi:putative tryptophan/tyrosine transport system substrate-binding protein